MSTASVIALPGLVLPETGPLRRHVRPPARRTPVYLERYDRRTLLYDAVRLPGGRICLTAPRLLNLWPLLRDGLRTEAGPVPRRALQRRVFLRCEQITLPDAAGGLSIKIAGTRLPVPLRDGAAAAFAGARVLMAVNKDNDPLWIVDWARFHAARHGADAVLVFDNGSTRYTADDIAARLAAVPGISRACVASAPFPYGPADPGTRFDVPPRFFQTAMLNLARRDLVARARSVLSVDIDELVTGPDGASVFEATERHPLGMCALPGRWGFPAPGAKGPAPQRDHRWQPTPPQPCHPKWCIAPSGPMGRLGWSVHRVGGPVAAYVARSRDFALLHCRATSTGWKPGRFAPTAALSKDPRIGDVLDDAFCSTPSRAVPAPGTAPEATRKRS